ncbi:hypothetical protein BD779DRAFT_1058523 [Infundibulicybe gibba]|nr:hypothetical protein BD779DRAFT_1058523 [Infundibulicybe gibba]
MSAQGIITSTSSSTFSASFTVGTETHTFVGQFSPPVPSFATESDKVELKYGDDDDLKGSRAFSGELGKSNISLLFSNPVTMDGPLVTERPAKVIIYGTGTWS